MYANYVGLLLQIIRKLNENLNLNRALNNFSTYKVFNDANCKLIQPTVPGAFPNFVINCKKTFLIMLRKLALNN